MTFKIEISQFYDQSKPKQWKWNKIRHFSMGHIQILRYIIFNKKILFQWLSKPIFLSFMSKVNSNNGNETKTDIFSWSTFKSDIIFHSSQNTEIIQWLLYLASFNSIGKVSTNKKIETKLRDMCKSDIFLIYKVVHYLNDFWNLFLDKCQSFNFIQ